MFLEVNNEKILNRMQDNIAIEKYLYSLWSCGGV